MIGHSAILSAQGGASENFVAPRLPDVLRELVRTHLLVAFELTVGLSGELNERLARGASLILSAASDLKAPATDAWCRAIDWPGCPAICPALISPHPCHMPSIHRPASPRKIARAAVEWCDRSRRSLRQRRLERSAGGGTLPGPASPSSRAAGLAEIRAATICPISARWNLFCLAMAGIRADLPPNSLRRSSQAAFGWPDSCRSRATAAPAQSLVAHSSASGRPDRSEQPTGVCQVRPLI